ncbi:MAG: 50S ribosomal protein L13 [Candidatus Aureabacteria bacterium]|nr:50S ribosomal protein L13 [Candidatus Auribacterota bacterium]
MKTTLLKKEDVKRTWYHFDAGGVRIGRLARQIAVILMGKNKPDYTPHVDSGDFVIVTNLGKIAISGKKEQEKLYYRHSGYIGGLKKSSFKELREQNPVYLLTHAVKGMLPKNKLASHMIKRLKIYKNGSHPHQAQNPKTITL